MATPIGYMVVFDDEQGLCTPYGADPDCEGAIAEWAVSSPPILFSSRAAARRAIRISKAKARLDVEQGNAYDPVFTEALGFVRIVPVMAAQESPQ